MKTVYTIIIVFFIFGSNINQKRESDCYHNINAADFNLIIETYDVILIDTRLFKEFRKERISGAILASRKENLNQILKEVSLNQQILIYCEEGSRSESAAQIICKEMNYKNVYNLSGGIISWKKKGYLTNKTRINKLHKN